MVRGGVQGFIELFSSFRQKNKHDGTPKTEQKAHQRETPNQSSDQRRGGTEPGPGRERHRTSWHLTRHSAQLVHTLHKPLSSAAGSGQRRGSKPSEDRLHNVRNSNTSLHCRPPAHQSVPITHAHRKTHNTTFLASTAIPSIHPVTFTRHRETR